MATNNSTNRQVLTGDLPAGSVVQVVNTETGTKASGSTLIPNDNTKPQKTEGDEYMTLAITPTSATNKLCIDVLLHCAYSVNTIMLAAIFQDTNADALVVGWTSDYVLGGVSIGQLHIKYYMTSGTTSATTFKVRAGAAVAGTFVLNGNWDNTDRFNGILISSITITEIKV